LGATCHLQKPHIKYLREVTSSKPVDLTGDHRATILGALLWMADKLKSDQAKQARALAL